MGSLILLAAIFIPVVLLAGVLMGWKYFVSRDKRRSPLNFKLFHLPGEQLRQRIAEEEEKLTEAVLLVAISGPAFLLAWLFARLHKLDWSRIELGVSDLILAMAGLAVLGYGVAKTIKHVGIKRRYRQGLEGELAVAQCLTTLIGEDCIVFHDVPAEKFNLDHVIIGPHVVFAVETKSRLKPEKTGSDSARVRYDGARLQFPEHIEVRPLEQARNQARWLAQYLGSAAGEKVKVVPVLALPGWFVESTPESRSADVVVNNCKNPRFVVSEKFGPPMAEHLRQRIAHALTLRYE